MGSDKGEEGRILLERSTSVQSDLGRVGYPPRGFGGEHLKGGVLGGTTPPPEGGEKGADFGPKNGQKTCKKRCTIFAAPRIKDIN